MKEMGWLLAAVLFPGGSLAQMPASPASPPAALAALASPPASPTSLPDAPNSAAGSGSSQPPPAQSTRPERDPCLARTLRVTNPEAASAERLQQPCAPPVASQNALARFVNSPEPTPMTSRQKAHLAFHDVVDPFNILTIFANSAFTVGIDSHSAYGPGMRGFGRSVGYSFSQDANGEFIGTYMVCSLLHEDPRYHRMPQGTPRQRLLHAFARTIIAQHDDGTLMPNYENFITYPASAELANLYVPGVHGNGPSTVARILTGLATDPVNNIITEFLPDFAKRVHINIVFVQQILNQIAANQQF